MSKDKDDVKPLITKLEERVDTVENKVEALESRTMTLETKTTVLEGETSDLKLQMARLMSHVVSELGLARGDTTRVEKRLFGEHEDDQYGGRIGQMARQINGMEVWFKGVIVASSILVFIITVWVFASPYLKVAK